MNNLVYHKINKFLTNSIVSINSVIKVGWLATLFTLTTETHTHTRMRYDDYCN